MRYRRIIVGFLAAAALTACSAPWADEPKPDDVIVSESLPPDSDQSASKRKARAFREARAEDGTIYKLAPSIDRVFGDWEKGLGRAFVATSLAGSQATSEDGKLIANAFAAWQNTETGDGRVSVYDKDGKLLYTGRF